MPRRRTRLPKRQQQLVSVLLGLFLVVLLNSALLIVFDQSTARATMSLVLMHIVLGTVVTFPLAAFLVVHVRKMPLRLNRPATVAGLTTAIAATLLLLTGYGLVGLGASAWGGALLWIHIGATILSVVGFAGHISLKKGVRYHFLDYADAWRSSRAQALGHPFSLVLLFGTAICAVVLIAYAQRPAQEVFVEAEGGPLLAQAQAALDHSGFLADDDLARSETCGQAGCHPDVYAQWSESMHRFSSFNNPYYKASIDPIVEERGTEAARWCASCHDPLVLFTGRFEGEMPPDPTHATSQAGLTCLSCHAIEGLQDVKGNGRYVIGRPDEYPLARAEGGVGQAVHNLLVRAKPEPHRASMLKPALKTQEFCGTCHKVGIPPEVNHYRWKRGQNQYDGWHQSGVSGGTVRSFYLPPQTQTCTSCHMPLVPSDDQGNDGGYIRSHRFAAANTALPYLNGHADQLRAAQEALQDSIVTLDLFQVTVNGTSYGPDDEMPPLRPGTRVEVDVVVRNRKVGHAFPAGTNDSNELWIELLARRADGTAALASGQLDAAGRVDSAAHVYGALLVDKDSQPIDRRNVHAWRATVYANTIGPGSADVARYVFTVPPGGAITSLEAALQYRKFKSFFNDWTFRHEAPAPDSALIVQARLTPAPGSGPVLPITTVAEAGRVAEGVPATRRPLWERWNDYGIGLFLQGDTRGALAAFGRVSEIAPENPEGPINEARVLLEEGNLGEAEARLAEAERRRPGYLKTRYFTGVLREAYGNYDDALEAWTRVAEAYPDDRTLLVQIGRMHYLSGRYDEALPWFDRALALDPEDVRALYNRMLTLGALGQDDAFLEARERYLYHKDDENAFEYTADYKRRHEAANNEAQPIHRHELRPPMTTDRRRPTAAF